MQADDQAPEEGGTVPGAGAGADWKWASPVLESARLRSALPVVYKIKRCNYNAKTLNIRFFQINIHGSL